MSAPLPPGTAAVLPLLRCPQCSGPDSPLQHQGDRTVGCEHGHRFDLARQGYLPLLGPRARTDTGDDAGMVAARARFLAGGHFSAIGGAVADAVGAAETVLEIGAGTGHYLAGTGAAVGIALDSSRYACRRAAAADPRIGAVLADAWAPLPVRTGVLDAVLVVFAPRGVAEIARVLRPGGRLVAVTPDPEHLAGVRGPLGMLEVDGGKADRLVAQGDKLLHPESATAVRATALLDRPALADLVAMGPAARHRTAEQIADAVAAVLPDPARRLEVGVAVTVTVLRR